MPLVAKAGTDSDIGPPPTALARSEEHPIPSFRRSRRPVFCLRKSPYAHVTVDRAAAGIGDTFTMTMAGDVPECVDANDTSASSASNGITHLGAPVSTDSSAKQARSSPARAKRPLSSAQAARPASVTTCHSLYRPYNANSNCQFGQPFGRPLSVTPSCTYRIVSAHRPSPRGRRLSGSRRAVGRRTDSRGPSRGRLPFPH